MSGFDEYAGYIGLRSFTRKFAMLFVAAVILGAGAAWLVGDEHQPFILL